MVICKYNEKYCFFNSLSARISSFIKCIGYQHNKLFRTRHLLFELIGFKLKYKRQKNFFAIKAKSNPGHLVASEEESVAIVKIFANDLEGCGEIDPQIWFAIQVKISLNLNH